MQYLENRLCSMERCSPQLSPPCRPRVQPGVKTKLLPAWSLHPPLPPSPPPKLCLEALVSSRRALCGTRHLEPGSSGRRSLNGSPSAITGMQPCMYVRTRKKPMTSIQQKLLSKLEIVLTPRHYIRFRIHPHGLIYLNESSISEKICLCFNGKKNPPYMKPLSE